MRHIKLGPPEPGEEETVSDEALKYMILGCMRSVPMLGQFPIVVRTIIDNFDDEGTIQSFTIVTRSGLRYTVKVEFDGVSP